MANFPIREPEIIRLAQDISNGLTANVDVFPTPPAAPEEIDRALAVYNAAREEAIRTSAMAVTARSARDAALKAVTDLCKTNLKYAEATTRNNAGKLRLLGWGAPREKTVNELQLPGQVVTLEVLKEGKTWVQLGWKTPFEGGKVSAYKIQRRKRESGDWLDVGTSVATEATLNAQESLVEWEYHVIAVNKAGEGPESNTVRAVL